MSDITIVRPADDAQLVQLWSRARARIDAPSQRRFFSDGYAQQGLDLGIRSPRYTFAAHDGDGHQLGLVAAQGRGVPVVVDVLDLPPDRPDVAHELLRHAGRTLLAEHSLAQLELIIFTEPSEDAPALPQVAPVVAAVEAAGFVPLVQRRNYALRPADDAWSPAAVRVRLEPVTEVTDPRLVLLHRAILRDSLDAHHVDGLARGTAPEVSDEELSYLVDANGIESFFIAVDDEGADVGMVVGAPWPGTARGAVSFIGVHPDHRGRGYAAQLASAMLRRVGDQGVEEIIADTDVTNVPMAQAFASIGLPQVQTRLDFVLR